MKLFAYTRLLKRKINSASRMAKNPFVYYKDEMNPFARPFSNTLVWIEQDEDSLNDKNTN